MNRYLYCLTFALAGLLHAAESNLSGPTLGYVYDANQAAARVVTGIPGSSNLGAAIATGIQGAVISPAHNYLLATTGEEKSVVLVTTGDGIRKALPDLLSGPDLIVLSPKGSAAVLFHSEGSRAQLVRGLPSNPEIAGDFTTYAGAARLAVSDDAERLLHVTPEGDVYSFTADGNSRRLSVSKIVAAAFLEDRREALLVQEESGAIIESEEMKEIARVPGASGVVAFSNNRKAVIANKAARQISVVDLEQGSVNTIDCSCNPDALQPLAGESLFRVTELSDGPTWILNAAAPQLQLTFVPAGGSRE